MKPIVLRDDLRGYFDLRPYQRDAAFAALEELNRTGSTLVVLPTGCGKTVLFSEIALRWPREAGRVLVLAHRSELIAQAVEKIELHTGERPSVDQAQQIDRKDLDGSYSPVLVASVQTITQPNRLQRHDPRDFGLIVCDEAHHATSVTWRRVIEYFRRGNPEIRVLGVTATPERADKVGLGWIFDTAAYRMELSAAIDDGWLVPIDQRYVAVEGLDFSVVNTVAGDLNEKQLEAQMLGGVVDPQTIEERKKQEAMIHKVIAPTIEIAAGRPTLVFCVTVAHAEKAAEVARRDYGLRAACVHGGSSADKRQETVKRFRAGQVDTLFGVGVFTEGFDAPSCSVVAIARPTKSKSLYIQCVGRGTRPLPGVVDGPETADERREAISASAKPRMTVIDFVGNSGRHTLVSSPDVLAGSEPPEIVEQAKRKIREQPGMSVKDALQKVREEREAREKAEQEARQARLTAQARYREQIVNPFTGESYTPAQDVQYRGGATDKQVAYLVRLGVPREKALGYSKRQAGAVIDSMTKRKPTRAEKTLDEINAELLSLRRR